MDMPTERFSEALKRREANRNAILNWIRSNLKLGIDYGQIHVFGKDKCRLAKDGRANECIDPSHWSKPSLWKPGAEKICGMLGLIPRFPNLKEYESSAMRGEDIKVIILKCELHTGSGFVAGEGTGARRIAQDNGDINKSIKMTEKSAHIDATLRVAGLSELFTQDIDDIPPGNGSQAPPFQSPQSQSTGKPSSQQPSRQTGGNNYSKNGHGSGYIQITGNQYNYIMDLIEKAGMSEQELNEQCVKTYGRVLDYISKGDASKLIEWLLKIQ
ncbi:hypothetical protein [Desulfobacterium sp. N47]|uniref:Uncharacterized protein n=1 Tax=uncultured Desulfobacterium sp. TaxID=201089 RepID=E1Y9A3_9BACT|nr:hypothetical protein N47_A11760 [uncultured Desulfobacterium sp.]